MIVALLGALLVPACDVGSPLRLGALVDAVSGAPAPASLDTRVSLCHRPTCLSVSFRIQAPAPPSSPFRRCNEPLYESEAVEAFLSAYPSPRLFYLETEVNPNNALFLKSVRNERARCPVSPAGLINCSSSGVRHAVGANFSSASLCVPYALFSNSQEAPPAFLANFFRISQEPARRFWAWSPTFAQPACFHVPKAFRQFKLV